MVIGTESGTDVSSEGAFVAWPIKPIATKVPTIHSQTGSLTTLRLYHLRFAEGGGKELSLIEIYPSRIFRDSERVFLESNKASLRA